MRSSKVVLVTPFLPHHGLAFVALAAARFRDVCRGIEEPVSAQRVAEALVKRAEKAGGWDQYETWAELTRREPESAGERAPATPVPWELVCLLPPQPWIEPVTGVRDGWIGARFSLDESRWQRFLDEMVRASGLPEGRQELLRVWYQSLYDAFREEASRDSTLRFLKLDWARQRMPEGLSLTALWPLVHVLSLHDQIRWWNEASPWRTSDRVRLEYLSAQALASEPERPLSEGAWSRGLDAWVRERDPDDALLFNLEVTPAAYRFACHFLKWARPRWRSAAFVGCPTRSDREDPRYLRRFYFRSVQADLLRELVAPPIREGHVDSPRRQAAREQLEFYKECGDLFVVLVLGPRGCGKSSTVRQIFGGAKYREVSAASFSGDPNMARSALFGHTKGAFTGADRAKAGVFAEADTGALFLDEFHRLPDEVIGDLLVALQTDDEGFFSFRPLGATTRRKAKFQLLLGSNRSFEKLRRRFESVPDFWDRVHQRVVHIPAFDPAVELDKAWGAVWKRMHFAGVANPLAAEADAGAFERWIKSIAEPRWFPGNFRDLEWLAIAVADALRLEARKPRILKQEIALLEGVVATSEHDIPQPPPDAPSWLRWVALRWRRELALPALEARSSAGAGSEPPRSTDATRPSPPNSLLPEKVSRATLQAKIRELKAAFAQGVERRARERGLTLRSYCIELEGEPLYQLLYSWKRTAETPRRRRA